MVTVGSMIANIASYLLHLPAGKWLGPAGYGEFASLLAAQLVLAVPALALQTVVAREVVRGRDTRVLRALGYRCAVIVGIAATLSVPVVSSALDSGALATFSALVTAPLLVLLATEQGLLQGSARFASLGIVLAAAGVAKVVPAVVVLAFGAGPGLALAASAVGTGIVALSSRIFAGTDATGVSSGRVRVTAVLGASQVQLALIALSSMDLVIARIVLSNDEAGIYALGAVATKAAFWLPQALGVVFYPRMASPEHSVGAIRSALVILLGLGAVLVVGAAAAAPLVTVLVDQAYRPVQSLLWLFALHGACLAVLQGALLSAIAGERTRLAVVVWIGFGIEMAAMLTIAGTVGQLIGIAVTVASSCALIVSVLALRGARRDARNALVA